MTKITRANKDLAKKPRPSEACALANTTYAMQKLLAAAHIYEEFI
jgi:hypothetical protein